MIVPAPSRALLSLLLFALPGALLGPGLLSAQTSENVILLSRADDATPPAPYNDCWGFVGSNGGEYAIIGHRLGTLFYRITDPEAPVLVGSIPGVSATHRDMKTNGDYCYITTEGAAGGIQIVDISDPDNPFLANTYLPNSLHTAHNLFVDTTSARAYVVGTRNQNFVDRGMKILDIGTDPINPSVLGSYAFPNPYIHDLHVVNDTAYVAEIDAGNFEILDCTNPSSINVLADVNVGFSAVHTAWRFDVDVDYMLTEDEEPGGHVKVWDISDLGSILQVGTYQFGGDEATTHNAHVKRDTAYVSYYQHGFRVVDMTDPFNPTEIGHYDTYPDSGAALFDGCWGVHAYLPSGTLIASDRKYGLFLLRYVEGSGLVAGTVTDTIGAFAVQGEVAIEGAGLRDSTDAAGQYEIGAPAGAVALITTAFGFAPDTTLTTILSDMTLTEDIALAPLPGASIAGQITSSVGGAPIPGASVRILEGPRDDLTGAGGDYQLPYLPSGAYTVLAAAFGFDADTTVATVSDGVVEQVDFSLDPWILAIDMESAPGWTVGSPEDSASGGIWERVDPNGTGGGFVQPEDDHTLAPGVLAWITGQSPPSASTTDNDVSGGRTTLTSSAYDVSTLANPEVIYHRWYTNSGAPDAWLVSVSDDSGSTWATVESTSVGAAEWVEVRFRVSDFVTPTEQLRVRFIASNEFGLGTVVEAGLDDFGIRNAPDPTGVTLADPFERFGPRARLLPNRPNPFNPSTEIEFSVPGRSFVTLSVYEVSGRLIRTLARDAFEAGRHTVTWDGRDGRGREVGSGAYFYRLQADRTTETRKMILLR